VTEIHARKGEDGAPERLAQVIYDHLTKAGYSVDLLRAPHGQALTTTDPQTHETLDVMITVISD
jgi:hypothetical protein